MEEFEATKHDYVKQNLVASRASRELFESSLHEELGREAMMLRSASSKSRVSEEESVPLTAFEGDEQDSPLVGSAARSPVSSPRLDRAGTKKSPLSFLDSTLFRRSLLLAVIVIALFRFLDWLYSDPEQWATSWKDALGPGAKLIDTPEIVTADWRRYRGDADEVMVSFRSMPYAQPPVGRLRFRAPKRLTKLSVNDTDTIIDARTYDQGCPRENPAEPGTFTGKEDCLSFVSSTSVSRRVSF